jgi:hypothetical protein
MLQLCFDDSPLAHGKSHVLSALQNVGVVVLAPPVSLMQAQGSFKSLATKVTEEPKTENEMSACAAADVSTSSRPSRASSPKPAADCPSVAGSGRAVNDEAAVQDDGKVHGIDVPVVGLHDPR